MQGIIKILDEVKCEDISNQKLLNNLDRGGLTEYLSTFKFCDIFMSQV